MYSFHSSQEEKDKLLFTLTQYGIETTVDRSAKKDRIRDWIQSSVIEEEDEAAAEGEMLEEEEEERAAMDVKRGQLRLDSGSGSRSASHWDAEPGQNPNDKLRIYIPRSIVHSINIEFLNLLFITDFGDIFKDIVQYRIPSCYNATC